MKKRFPGVILAAVLFIATLTINTFALSTDPKVQTLRGGSTISFGSLPSAVNTATEGDIVTLTGEVSSLTLPGGVTISKNITFTAANDEPSSKIADESEIIIIHDPDVFTPGDLNNDNKINASDAAILKKVIVGKIERTAAADVDGDGKISVSDAVFLRRKIVGKA